MTVTATQKRDSFIKKVAEVQRERHLPLLREIETCNECGKKFSSLYPVKFCHDHNGLDEQ